MPPVRVRRRYVSIRSCDLTPVCRSSVYQDVPVHSLEEFVQLAPEEAKSESVLSDEHQLMLNRLSFELAERQRYCHDLRLLFVLLTSVHLQTGPKAQGAHEAEGGAAQREQGQACHDGQREGTNRLPHQGVWIACCLTPHRLLTMVCRLPPKCKRRLATSRGLSIRLTPIWPLHERTCPLNPAT